MNRRKPLYEGKAKDIFEGPEPGTLIQYFKDDATAPNAKKNSTISGKGVLNNRISAHIMTKLENIGIPTHFIRSMNMREQLVRQVEIVPIQLVVRNIAAGSICERLGVEEGKIFPQPIVEYFYKKAELNDPIISESHIVTLGWADPYELEEMVGLAYRVNDYLSGLFEGMGLTLVDFRLEFGRIFGEYGELYIILADEVSPDNCRIWDMKSGDKIDKDRFNQDLENFVEGYQEIAKRLGLIPEGGIIQDGTLDEKMSEGLDTIENEQSKVRRLRSVPNAKSTKPRKT